MTTPETTDHTLVVLVPYTHNPAVWDHDIDTSDPLKVLRDQATEGGVGVAGVLREDADLDRATLAGILPGFVQDEVNLEVLAGGVADEADALARTELIAEQQLEVRALRKALEHATRCRRAIASRLTCMGGALNDNVLGYTAQQRQPLHDILGLAEEDLDEHTALVRERRGNAGEPAADTAMVDRLVEAVRVAVVVLYGSHPDDACAAFTVDELATIGKATEHLQDIASVELVYRHALGLGPVDPTMVASATNPGQMPGRGAGT